MSEKQEERDGTGVMEGVYRIMQVSKEWETYTGNKERKKRSGDRNWEGQKERKERQERAGESKGDRDRNQDKKGSAKK